MDTLNFQEIASSRTQQFACYPLGNISCSNYFDHIFLATI